MTGVPDRPVLGNRPAGTTRRTLLLGGGASILGLATVGLAACTASGTPAPTLPTATGAGAGAGADPTLTGIVFADGEFDGQLLRALDVIPYRGADFGEAFITARTIADGDEEAWFAAWQALADRIYADAELSLAAGHRVSARDGFARAATYYRTSGVFMYKPPIDDRFVQSYRQQQDAFRRASELMDWSIRPVSVPFDGRQLDAYFATPPGSGLFPVVVLVDGYDGTLEETFFAGGAAALERGYAILMMDGPGQGGALIEQGMVFRPDWESVVGAEIDWLVAQPEVDASRIALLGRSWGGFLAPRAATAEHRVAAVIADAPQFTPGAGAKDLLPKEYRDRFDEPSAEDDAINEALYAQMEQSTALAFSMNRGMLTHGVESPLAYLREMTSYSLAGIAADITCPVLLTTGENDPRNGGAQDLYDALTSAKEYIPFRNAEGGGQHDEEGAALLFGQRAFDWLDAALAR
ncbi:alpha/beta hydrolase family protein [Microbacterium sp. I2]|uniref:alpha/beta hydrolase family protein n=1 Tax=Microbacterium sp. I2 TaxID=3391826 RepID=UPI003ED9F0EF